MIRSARSAALLLARLGTVAFALTACGYLVVTAQRRANPVPTETPVAPVADVLPPPASDAPFLPSSKVLVIDGSDALTVDVDESEARADDPTFLLGTKSAPIAGTVLEGSATPESGFLYSSKSGAVYVPSPLMPGTVTPDGVPLPASQAAPNGTTSPAGPVFLPSSKAKAPLTEQELQSLVPGKVSSSRRVFLPSSKSLRIDPVAPKPLPAPAPVDPPKNP